MRLKMPIRQRIGVSVLFGLGFIVIVAGGVRTYYIWKGVPHLNHLEREILADL